MSNYPANVDNSHANFHDASPFDAICEAAGALIAEADATFQYVGFAELLAQPSLLVPEAVETRLDLRLNVTVRRPDSPEEVEDAAIDQLVKLVAWLNERRASRLAVGRRAAVELLSRVG